MLLAGCGGGGTAPATTPTPAQSSSPSTGDQAASPARSSSSPVQQEPEGPVVEVSISGKSVTPKGTRIQAKVGEPVTFVVTSDRAGGLHVHSSPEQTPEFSEGTTTIQVTIDKPGVVEVEEHESDALIVQIEAR
ncbi:hypothetical protein FB381_1082 [Nocardioides albertanoniae]|uniref:Uncharacterized protein n=2 Tax=Nocardioidaceae TaxID=85015 RepID=A0A543A3Q2_9ACTN|nr:hypothetical protein FB381_1082 [Nocardioides albertanoniae]